MFATNRNIPFVSVICKSVNGNTCRLNLFITIHLSIIQTGFDKSIFILFIPLMAAVYFNVRQTECGVACHECKGSSYLFVMFIYLAQILLVKFIKLFIRHGNIRYNFMRHL